MIRAVIFDLDGLLLDSESAWDGGRKALVAEHDKPWPDGATEAMLGMSSPEWSRYVADELGVPLAPEEISGRVVEHVLRRYDEALPLLPGAEEAVAQIQELGRRPDIVIADYRLQEGRTGIKAILAVRALFAHPIPGLILTGETDLKFLRECTGHDVGIAHKPVMPSQLGLALSQQLNLPTE